MDTLYRKANTLLDIWVELGFADAELAELPGVQLSPRGTSEWARRRMQRVLDELDRLIEYERQEKQRLSAEIEDLLFSIDDTCTQLGQRIENVTSLAAIPETIERSHPMKRYLRKLNDELLEELNRRRTNVRTWLDAIKSYAAEIYEVHEMPPFEAYENDLTWATVQSVFVKYNALHTIVTTRRQTFENAAAKLRFYWHALRHQTSDSIDEALAELFSQYPPDIPPSLPADDIPPSLPADDIPPNLPADDIPVPQYYRHPLPSLLSLTPSCLDLLNEKLATLEEDYRDRLAKRDRYQKGILLLWGELEVPVEERTVQMVDSFDLVYLEQVGFVIADRNNTHLEMR
ncbi:hypothetical protein BC936DRAFT_140972 [Jimgerdemannia flammicorona]|uniref:Microtubule associated protein-domain-containing protein n=1 Tax=Jimgerdemannia flammicorona TaxID=994334 RepID=A0A433A347_9FUNG|nr:hypothetical protein BC936DRAFT_140972 [Jimgerdemannia flammicorona]